MTMSPVVERPPTPAEQEQPPLVAEIEHLRALLEAYRDGETGVPPPPVAAGFEPAVDRLARLVGLSPFERRLLLLAAAVELDGEVAALVAALQQSADPRPTFGLALLTLPEPHWDALAPGSPLRRLRLLELGPGPTLAARPLRIDERVLHYVTGIDAPDERLEGVLRAGVAPPLLALSQHRLAVELARTAADAGPRVLVRIDGQDMDARLGVAHVFAATLGRTALVVRGDALPPPGLELAGLARLVDREAILVAGLPVVVGEGDLEAFFDELAAPIAVVVGEGAVRAGSRVALHRSVGLPSPAESRALWADGVGRAHAGRRRRGGRAALPAWRGDRRRHRARARVGERRHGGRAAATLSRALARSPR